MNTRYILITPVRDEARHIGKTLASVVAQTVPPLRWIVVDDGSTDGTGAILDSHAARVPWIEVLHRENRGYRAAGGGVVEAFYAGYSAVADGRWDFIVKLDGDLSFAPDYFEECFRIFAAEPGLGIGGGTVCRLERGRTKVDSAGDPPFHVRGATKIYRRACWERIQPLVAAPGWDTIDEVKANLHGWTTRTFRNLEVIQHKPTGGADGYWRDGFKNGLANYITGYHPAFMLAKCIKRVPDKPVFLASAALLAGYLSGYARGVPRVPDGAMIRYLRGQQMRRLLLRPGLYR
jgi:biofilm PGA synthesis N-glycosyltransferase PgaC